MVIDVSGWLLVAEWDARAESADAIAARIVQTSAAVLEAFPSFNDTWTVHDRTIPGADARSWGGVIAASPYRVDGVAEPARGSALSLVSEFESVTVLRAVITAGATFQTTLHKPNEFALDFVADPFNARIEVDLPERARRRFGQLGAEIQRVWAAGDLRVEYG